ncbi:MAG TPA: hypothetical protein VGM08_01445 [Candidatus Saccharimonadales bacterium]
MHRILSLQQRLKGTATSKELFHKPRYGIAVTTYFQRCQRILAGVAGFGYIQLGGKGHLPEFGRRNVIEAAALRRRFAVFYFDKAQRFLLAPDIISISARRSRQLRAIML